MPAPTHFELLGLPAALDLETADLQQRFHSLSRNLHPDRFASAPPREQGYALRWTTALNRAYQALRDPVSRSYYLLELFEGEAIEKATSKLPLDLAESYFELQDLLLESGNQQPLKEFHKNLIALQKENLAQWQKLAEEWGKAPSPASFLPKLREHLVKRKYLSSMLADLERKLDDSRN